MSKLSGKGTFFSEKNILTFGGKQLIFTRPLVMGIVNITPDSFYDGGKITSVDDALAQADRMISQGASILDIGAMSTRPGSDEIAESEELHRLIPVLTSVRNRFPDIPLSVDTYRSNVAEEALQAGADIINDISGGTFDANMFEVISRQKAGIVIMHIQGTPQNMQHNPQYNNVVEEVLLFLQRQRNKLIAKDVRNIIIDPGFGFGKTVDQNYTLLSNLDRFHELEYPVMVGLSRKSMINRVLSIKPQDALNGTSVLHTIAILKGAHIIRVHDVKPAMEVIDLVMKYFHAEDDN